MKTFIFDLDDTICLTDPTVFDMFFSLFDTQVTTKERQDRENFFMYENDWATKDQEKRVLTMMRACNVYRHLPLMPGVKEWFWTHGVFNEIIFVTNREEELRDQTVYWLKNCGITANSPALLMRNDSVGRGKKENLQFLLDGILKERKMEDVYFIENAPWHVEEAISLGFPNIVTFDYKYNKKNNFKKRGLTVLPNPELKGFKWKI